MDKKAFLNQFPDENSARQFLERIIWKDGRFCPHCGSVKSWAITGETARPGLYDCGDCYKQFTVTTKTPMHSTKLPLRTWLEVIYYMIQSSKGVSSVKIAQWVGISQKTAWKVCHAVRLLMRMVDPRMLHGIVELDEKYLGGKPRKHVGVKSKRGKGTKKQGVFVAVERGGGQVHAETIESDTAAIFDRIVKRVVERKSHLMTDEHASYRPVGRDYEKHSAVRHKGGVYAEGDVHNNTAESFNAILERMKFGVYHWWSRPHFSKYLHEAQFRWNNREIDKVYTTAKGRQRTLYRPTDIMSRLDTLLATAFGKQMRRTTIGGIVEVTT